MKIMHHQPPYNQIIHQLIESISLCIRLTFEKSTVYKCHRKATQNANQLQSWFYGDKIMMTLYVYTIIKNCILSEWVVKSLKIKRKPWSGSREKYTFSKAIIVWSRYFWTRSYTVRKLMLFSGQSTYNSFYIHSYKNSLFLKQIKQNKSNIKNVKYLLEMV